MLPLNCVLYQFQDCSDINFVRLPLFLRSIKQDFHSHVAHCKTMQWEYPCFFSMSACKVMSSAQSGHFNNSSKTSNKIDKSINIVPSLTVSIFSELIPKCSLSTPIFAPEGPGSGTASLSRGSPSLNFLAFFDGGILARFLALFCGLPIYSHRMIIQITKQNRW